MTKTFYAQRWIALAYAAFGLLACDGDISGPNTDDFPDISGRWTVSLTAVPGGTDGSEGSCELDPIELDLTPAGTIGVVEWYTGNHFGGRIACSGLSAAAIASSGWRDTVILLPPDSLSASVGRVGCFIGLPCSGPSINASIRITSTLAVGGTADEQSMAGDFLLIDRDTIRLEGAWSAER